LNTFTSSQPAFHGAIRGHREADPGRRTDGLHVAVV